jgi:hypothetical protein
MDNHFLALPASQAAGTIFCFMPLLWKPVESGEIIDFDSLFQVWGKKRTERAEFLMGL